MAHNPPESTAAHEFGPETPLGNRPYPFLAPPLDPTELGRLGDYRVFRLLGIGGMGLVFEAEEMALRRRVALKVLKPDLATDPDSRERFLREARAAAALDSDHVVTIYHVESEETPYLAMQFLEGESVQARIGRHPPMTLRDALEIARQTALGLAAAHEKGVVHRDVKPANLWIEPKDPQAGPDWCDGATFRVKLLDFGLARRYTGELSLTSTGFVVGTPNYMSPEQASGMEVDGRGDLFSLGCVMYAMLLGRLPFEGNSAMAVMMALANTTPPLVSDANPDISVEVGELVAKLLEKKPENRFPTARAVVTAIDGILGRLSGRLRLPLYSEGAPTQPHPVGETLVPPTQPGAGPSSSAISLTMEVASPVQARDARRLSRRVWAFLTVGVVAAIGFGAQAWLRPTPPPEPILVGVLHSQTGTMAVSELPVRDATLLAIEEVNAAGGVLGRQLKPVLIDGKSDPAVFALEADRAMEVERVTTFFGCWTSASRKAVADVMQRRKEGLLIYPVQYEGLEHSPHVVYLGPTPNQQILPALDYLIDTLGKRRLYFVGSDYVYPRAVHAIIQDRVAEKKKAGVPVELVGSSFLPLAATGTESTMAVGAMTKLSPDAVINAVNGSGNLHFFGALRDSKQGIASDKVPTLSLSLTENEVMGLNPPSLAGDYLAASYFQTIDRPQSREFVGKLRERYEPDPVATDPVAAAYTGVHLWAKAATKAGTTDPAAVREAFRGLEWDGPRTREKIDPENLHAWLPARVGRIRPDGLVDVVAGAGSEAPIRPTPYPPMRTTEAWNQLLRGLQFRWEGMWQPPDKK